MHKRHPAGILIAVAGCIGLGLMVHSRFSSTVTQVQAANTTPTPIITSASEPTDRSPEIYQGSFFYHSTDEMLQALKVTVYPQDKVYAFPDPALGIGSTIKVYRAQLVSITDGDTTSVARTWGTTVQDVLTEQNIELGTQDEISPDLTTAVSLGNAPFAITITRVAESTVVVASSIDFSTTYTDDPTMNQGTTAVDTAGQKGVQTKTYLVRRENGVEVSRTLTDSEVTVKPVTQVIRRGTKVVSYGTGLASWYEAPSMTAAHRTLPFGTKVRVVNTSNGKSVVVTIADRGPFVAGRIIDLSPDAFAAIASLGSGVANVRLEVP